jgi:hypothetical protein
MFVPSAIHQCLKHPNDTKIADSEMKPMLVRHRLALCLALATRQTAHGYSLDDNCYREDEG